MEAPENIVMEQEKTNLHHGSKRKKRVAIAVSLAVLIVLAGSICAAYYFVPRTKAYPALVLDNRLEVPCIIITEKKLGRETIQSLQLPYGKQAEITDEVQMEPGLPMQFWVYMQKYEVLPVEDPAIRAKMATYTCRHNWFVGEKDGNVYHDAECLECGVVVAEKEDNLFFNSLEEANLFGYTEFCPVCFPNLQNLFSDEP